MKEIADLSFRLGDIVIVKGDPQKIAMRVVNIRDCTVVPYGQLIEIDPGYEGYEGYLIYRSDKLELINHAKHPNLESKTPKDVVKLLSDVSEAIQLVIVYLGSHEIPAPRWTELLDRCESVINNNQER